MFSTFEALNLLHLAHAKNFGITISVAPEGG